MAEKKSAAKKAAPKKAASAKSSTKAASKASKTSTGSSVSIASASGSILKLGALKPAEGSWPKRQRIGRGHGSGMVKTGGEGGKGQTVRSGGGKGPAFEGGQTPWARRLPHGRGYSQKGRDTGHFGTTYAVINLHQLAEWDTAVEVTPDALKAKGIVKSLLDGVKVLGASKVGKALPSGLKFRHMVFSSSARAAIEAAGGTIIENI
jgi:large subunit ribosomal protein L15